MSKSLITSKPRVPTTAERITRRARAYVDASKAPNTQRAYESAWRDFGHFCDRFHADHLPALPETVAAYITEQASDAGHKVRTIEVKLAAISHYHTRAQIDDPTHDQRVVTVMQGIRRSLGVGADGKEAISREDLAAMVATFPDDLRGHRDEAMLLLGFAGAFRRSELCALNVEDLRFVNDEMIVTLRSSKTDQEKRGTTKAIPAVGGPLCPIRALKLWLRESEITSGPVFRKINRGNHIGNNALTPQVVAWIVKEAAERTGLDAENKSGHSLRVGFVSQASADGRELEEIMAVTLHKTPTMVMHYNREKETLQLRAIRGVLKGDHK